jgi:hypothetical protein
VSIDFDFGEVLTLSADFGEAGTKVVPFARAALEVSARHIKDDWREEADGVNSSLKRYGAAVSYDIDLNTDGGMSAEIGPDLSKRQGTFGFIEEANGGVRSAPQRNVDKALRRNLADFEKGMAQAGEDALK